MAISSPGIRREQLTADNLNIELDEAASSLGARSATTVFFYTIGSDTAAAAAADLAIGELEAHRSVAQRREMSDKTQSHADQNTVERRTKNARLVRSSAWRSDR